MAVLDLGQRVAAVDVRGVWHAYAGWPALGPLDLEVSQGELLAVLGPSGCGKSTLLRILAGLLEPSGGSVLLDGQTPLAARRGRSLGWLAQDDGLLPWRSVADNVALPLRLAGRSADNVALPLRLAGRSADAPVRAMLERVGLGDSARRYPHQLSGGMRQRAALARALVARPSWLLLDEPFAHLDELTRERLGDLLLELRQEGPGGSRPTVVLVTHSVSEAVRLADRVVVLSASPGRVLLDQPLALRQPRTEDDAEFGRTVAHLKAVLAHAR